MELRLRLRRVHLVRGSNSVRWISRPALNPLNYEARSGYSIVMASACALGALELLGSVFCDKGHFC